MSNTGVSNNEPPLVFQRGKWVPYRGDWKANRQRVAANGTMKQSKAIRVKFPGTSVEKWVRVYRPIADLPTLDTIDCDVLYHPLTQKKLSGVEELQAVMEEIKANPPPKSRQLFDPCTKRLAASLKALEERVEEIVNYKENDENLFRAFPALFRNKLDIPDEREELRENEGYYFNALCKCFLLFGGLKGVHINPVVGNFEFLEVNNPSFGIALTVEEILKSIKIQDEISNEYDQMMLRRIATHHEEEEGEGVTTTAPVCEVGCQQVAAATSRSRKQVQKSPTSEEVMEGTFLLRVMFDPRYRVRRPPYPRLDTNLIEYPLSEIYFVNNNEHRRDDVRVIQWKTQVRPFLQKVYADIKGLIDRENITYLEAIKRLYFPQNATRLQLQLHQDIIVQGVRKQLAGGADNRFLIGVLPRGGKTYIAGGLIRDYMIQKRMNYMNVVWITAAPNETRIQLQKELVRKFVDFRGFEFVEVKETTDLVKSKPQTIFFLSSQLLTQIKAGKARSRDYLSELLAASGMKKINMVFFDEAHKTGVGKSTKEEVEQLLEKYRDRSLPFIFLTATYYQILEQYKIPPSNTFIWDYTDVLSTRFLGDSTKHDEAVQTLNVRFGADLVKSVLDQRQRAGQDFTSMAKSYADYPDLHFLSLDFSPDAIQLFASQDNFSMEAGFHMWKILQIKEGATVGDFKTNSNKIRADAHEMFQTPESAEAIVTYLTPSSDEGANAANINVPKPSHALLQRIHNISHATGSRFKLSENPSMLMFIPTGRAGTNVFYTMAAWASLLMNNPWWQARYEVACVVDGENIPRGMERREGLVDAGNIHLVSKNVKENLLRLEHDLKCKHKKGLVVLAGEKMSMGVSLPCVDVVMLFNDKSSPDDIIQKMYRAVTPSPGKKTAFIVDLSPKRTLTAVYGYTKISAQRSLSSYDIFKILYSTYHWDEDLLPRGKEQLLLGDKEATFQGMFRKLYSNAQTNQTKRKAANEVIRKLNNAFTGKKTIKKSNLMLGNENITHEENLALLKPHKNQILALEKDIMANLYQEQQVEGVATSTGLTRQRSEAAKKYRANFKYLQNTRKQKERTLKTMIVDYKKLVAKTRKKRQDLEKAAAKAKAAAEASEAKAKVAAEAAEAKARAAEEAKAEKARAAEEAAAAKARAKEEAATAKTRAAAEAAAAKLRAKEEAAAAKARAAEEAAAAKAKAKEEAATRKREEAEAKARVKAEAARIKAELERAKRSLGSPLFTRKRKTNSSAPAPAPPPSWNANRNTESENE